MNSLSTKNFKVNKIQIMNKSISEEHRLHISLMTHRSGEGGKWEYELICLANPIVKVSNSKKSVKEIGN